MHSTRQVPRSSTVHLRALAAAALALVVVLAFAAVAVAAPVASIDTGPTDPTRDALPTFGFTVDGTATTVECSIVPAGTPPAYSACTSPTTAPDTPLDDGDWVFWLRAADDQQDATELQWPFTVDTVARFSIDSGPSDPNPTNDPTPQFRFTTEAGATAECAIDQDPYAQCTSPYDATQLGDGSHTFHLRVTDSLGNQGETLQPFTVDTVDPSLDGLSGPSVTNDPTPTFVFNAEPGAGVQCSIDLGIPSYGSCSSPFTPALPLVDGRYTFRVLVTDAAGNTASASQRVEIDSLAPSLTIDSGPPARTNDTTPSFGFTADDGTSVQCAIDQTTLPYGACTTGSTYAVGRPLSEGMHVFRVRAIDDAGNDAIVQRSFTVDTTPPALSIAFGPSGTTSDSTPLFGFAAEAGATVECSIDQGTPAYGPCASTTTDAAVAPLADGAYVFRVRATDRAGNQTVATRAFTVDTAPASGAPAPPVTTPAPPAPSKPQLLSPFPLVRISGTLTASGARIRLLSVRAGAGTLVRVTVTPPCGGRRRSSPRCHVLQASGTVGRRDLIAFRSLARAYRSGTVIVVRVWRADRIGKYTRFTIVRGKAPRRVDQCLMPGATGGSRCPSA